MLILKIDTLGFSRSLFKVPCKTLAGMDLLVSCYNEKIKTISLTDKLYIHQARITLTEIQSFLQTCGNFSAIKKHHVVCV